MTAHAAAILDTSIIAALRLYDPSELPGTILITAVTLGELSFGPHATGDSVKRAGRVAVLQHVESRPWLPSPPRGRGAFNNRNQQRKMAPVADGAIVATARFSQHAAVDGNGAWIVSTHPTRLFSRNQAITAMTLAERLTIGYSDDPFVMARRGELFPWPTDSSGS